MEKKLYNEKSEVKISKKLGTLFLVVYKPNDTILNLFKNFNQWIDYIYKVGIIFMNNDYTKLQCEINYSNDNYFFDFLSYICSYRNLELLIINYCTDFYKLLTKLRPFFNFIYKISLMEIEVNLNNDILYKQLKEFSNCNNIYFYLTLNDKTNFYTPFYLVNKDICEDKLKRLVLKGVDLYKLAKIGGVKQWM